MTLAYGEEIGSVLTWLPQALVDIYLDAWMEHGDAARAWAAVRVSDQYETYFAGNVREDGTLRHSELEYLSIMSSYRDTISEVGLNPDLFMEGFVANIEGETSPNEFQARVDSLVERVWLQSEEIMQAYVQEGYALDLTLEELIASALDPTVGNAILNQQITTAEIIGEAGVRNIEIDTDLAGDLFGAGFDRGAAQQLFGQAAELLPTLSILAARHADPDDDFDINEFTAGTVFSDYEQKVRMRRLINQERSSFTQSGYFGTASNERTGGLTGLEQR